MKKLTFSKNKLFRVLDVVKVTLILLLVIMFINFNAKVAQQASDTQAIAQSTNDVVKGQKDILTAIKQVTDDTRITAVQQTAIIICMLQVPIDDRTTDLQTQCRDRATAADEGNTDGISQSSTDNSVGSSSNPTPATTTPQSNTPQESNTSSTPPPVITPNCAVDLGLGRLVLHLGC